MFSEKWWKLRPVNSDGSSDMHTIHWGHHFKRLNDKGNITNNTLKTAYNNLCVLYHHHLLRYGSRIFPYFDFSSMKFVKDGMKEIAKINIDKIGVKVKEGMEAREKMWVQIKTKGLIQVSKLTMFSYIMY